MTRLITELEIKDIKRGKGPVVKKGDTLQLHYSGTFLDNEEFDSSYSRRTPFEFCLGAGEVIKGWDLGIIGMHVGGIRELIIPPDLAYGSTGAGAVIPPDTPLRFHVELLTILKD